MKKKQILWVWFTLACVFLLSGCDAGGLRTFNIQAKTAYFNMFVNTAVFPTNQGAELKFQVGKANGQVFLTAGKATISGTLIDVSGGGQPFPSTFQVKLTHKGSKGKVLNTWSANVSRNADGKIPLQSIPFPGFILQPKETLQLALQPLDGNLPFSQLKVRVKLIAS